ncbi:uncharacterized protein L203_102098 [Cryptococcus depauperatus CBS 7841]|uniref:Uncharacterized protein n=1 Tax=Cryptococcus depauperatus CBS 7841 TaxID=1295531 RepID=A0A1E3IRB5_9TREE|nr:hypothetical protein L203_01350 [Cryptococcus depauperatus CBS 7841]
MAGINPVGLTFSMRPTPLADHPAPPSSGDTQTPVHYSGLTDSLVSVDSTASMTPSSLTARRRGRPSTRGDPSQTPPPEIGWWEDRAPSWHKDAMPGGKSSMDLLIEWSEEMKNQGHYYWMGVRDGGNLHQGASRFRDYLYAQRGPIRRSTKAIRNKVENIKQKFFEAQDWLKDPNGDHVAMTIPEVEKRLNKFCRNYRFWETIFVENVGNSLQHQSQDVQSVQGSSVDQTLHAVSQQQAQQVNGQVTPGPFIRGIPVPDSASEPDAQRNVRRRLNDGTYSSFEHQAALGRIPPLAYLERTREEREREKHEMNKMHEVLTREQLDLERRKEEREQKKLEWEQNKHLVDVALRIKELDNCHYDMAMAKAKALTAQAQAG